MSRVITRFAIAAYLVALIPSVRSETWTATALTIFILMMLENKFKFGWLSSLVLVVISYAGQDLAHYVTGEKTFQSSYSDGGQIDLTNLDFWISQFYEHCFYLLPLCADLVLRPLNIDLDTKYQVGQYLSEIYDFSTSVTIGMLAMAVLSYKLLYVDSSSSFSSNSNNNKKKQRRVVRVWTDMVADLYHHGHMMMIRNTRKRVARMHPDCDIWVGVGIHSDALVKSFHRNPVMTMEERVSAVRASCLADAVYPNAPMGITREFMLGIGPFTADRHPIDYVAVDEGKSFHAADKIRELLLKCEDEKERVELTKEFKARVKYDTQYKIPQEMGKFLVIPCLKSISTNALIGRIRNRTTSRSPSPRKGRVK
jgi:glycerol-3-phosphate cytidylyltransferase-like family protein